MNILVSHPTGNANLRAAIAGLDAADSLKEFHTSLAMNPDSPWVKLLPFSIRKELLRRTFPVNQFKIHAHPFKEIGRLMLPRMGIQKLTEHEVGRFSVDAVYHSLDKHVAKRLAMLGADKLNAVYAYEDGAQSTFRVARTLGIHALYDLPIGYWRAAQKLLHDDKDHNPDWAETLAGFKDSKEKLDRKDRELELADQIFVASSFTRKTLEQFPGKLAPVHVIPYGFPEPGEEKEYSSLKQRKLKLLFVGGLSQRKGLSYLFEAVNHFDEQVELTIVGRKPVDHCKALNKALSKHRWIESLPHDAILELMREQDVLVFPSLFEGFGLVVTEAMSQGVPVITTERTCGPDIITEGEDGWLINAGSSEEIEMVFDDILTNPQKLKGYGQAARKKATSRPWSQYGKELNEKIIELL
jgi:glycosyltransferase involved in cell wall biosynthesis